VTSPGRSLRRAGGSPFDSAPASRVLRRHRLRILGRAFAFEGGLPTALEEPLRWLAAGELGGEDRRRVEQVERLRAELAAQPRSVPNVYGGTSTLARLTEVASIDRRFGTLLYLCAKAIGARAILELGACLGIGTAYMGSAGCEQIVSIEATPERAEIARRTAREANDGAEIVVGRFDDALPGVLDEVDPGLDMAWIDGNHRRDATLRYLETIRPRLNVGAIVAFDDIRWSREMIEAWRTLQRADGFSHNIDLGRIGLGVWGGAGAAPRVHDLRGIFGPPRPLQRLLHLLRRP
jgi:predicted O-methyltransferase YrrM